MKKIRNGEQLKGKVVNAVYLLDKKEENAEADMNDDDGPPIKIPAIGNSRQRSNKDKGLEERTGVA